MKTNYEAEKVSAVDCLKKARRLHAHLKDIDTDRQAKSSQTIPTTELIDAHRSPFSFCVHVRTFDFLLEIATEYSIP